LPDAQNRGCPHPPLPAIRRNVLCVSVWEGAAATPLYTRLMDELDHSLSSHSGRADEFALDVLIPQWRVRFATAPEFGREFRVGSYLAVEAGDSWRMAHPGVWVDGFETGCRRGPGRFTVLEVEYGFGEGVYFERFAANFEMYCSSTRTVSGAVRYQSDVPLNAGELSAPAPVPTGVPPLR
jgi:hypothetical protein